MLNARTSMNAMHICVVDEVCIYVWCASCCTSMSSLDMATDRIQHFQEFTPLVCMQANGSEQESKRGRGRGAKQSSMHALLQVSSCLHSCSPAILSTCIYDVQSPYQCRKFCLLQSHIML